MLKIYTLTRDDCLASNCYIVVSGNESLVIDPSVSLNVAVSQYPELSDKLFKLVLLTHAHADHFLEISSYTDAGAKVVVSEQDSEALNNSYLNCALMILGKDFGYSGERTTLKPEEALDFSHFKIKSIPTPGHTPGSVCYIIDNNLFSGDTMFSHGGYGRYDLPLGDGRALAASLKRLVWLEGEFILYPGHGECSDFYHNKVYFKF